MKERKAWEKGGCVKQWLGTETENRIGWIDKTGGNEKMSGCGWEG